MTTPSESNLDNWLKEDERKKPECKGLIFRCERTAWIGSNADVNFKTKFKLLKRKSCPGCDQCGFMWDDLGEFISMGYSSIDSGDPIMHNGMNGKLYKLKVTNISTDWETGIADEYDLEFEEYHEENLEQNT